MKKLLIAILAVAALTHANQCEDIAEQRIDDLKNCKFTYNDDNRVDFYCSNGKVALIHKNDSTRVIGVINQLNMNESEIIVVGRSGCFISAEDKYGVRETKFESIDVEPNSTLNLWGYFKRHLVR